MSHPLPKKIKYPKRETGTVSLHRVVVCSPEFSKDGVEEDIYGLSNTWKRTIILKADQPAKMEARYFFHELLHQCERPIKIPKMPHDLGEMNTFTLSENMFDIFCLQPDLLLYLYESITGKEV